MNANFLGTFTFFPPGEDCSQMRLSTTLTLGYRPFVTVLGCLGLFLII